MAKYSDFEWLHVDFDRATGTLTGHGVTDIGGYGEMDHNRWARRAVAAGFMDQCIEIFENGKWLLRFPMVGRVALYVIAHEPQLHYGPYSPPPGCGIERVKGGFGRMERWDPLTDRERDAAKLYAKAQTEFKMKINAKPPSAE